MTQLIDFLKVNWKKEMTQEDLDALYQPLQNHGVDKAAFMKAIDQVGAEQLAYNRQKRVIDFETCPASKIVNGFEIRKATVPINAWSHKVIYNLINMGEKFLLPANDYCFIPNPHDEPSIRGDFNQYIILEAAKMIDFDYETQEEDGTVKNHTGKLEVFDRGCYQPTVLIDADYPDKYFFTIRNDTDEPSELHSLIVEAIHVNKSLVPRIDHETTYRLPIVQCQHCLSQPMDMIDHVRSEQMMRVHQLVRGSEMAAGLDLKTDPFILHPRGVKVFQLIRFFKYREMENSPHQFILRSRMSREGMGLTVTTETINDESIIKFVVTNNTDCEMQVPNRFIQFVPPVTMHINTSLVECGEPSHKFLHQKTKARKSKINA